MPQPILSRAIEGFLLTKAASGRSPYTIRNYKAELRRFTKWVGDKPVDAITSRELAGYLKYLKEDFLVTHVATTPIRPRKLTQKSLRNAWATLSVFWKWAANELEIDNPFNVAPIPARTKPVSPLNMDEVERMLKACEQSKKKSGSRKTYASRRNTGKRDKAIIFTLLDSGMRVGELCGIDIGDFNFDIGRILVSGKGNKERFVYLGKLSRQAIWRYLLERFPNEKPPEHEPLFVANDGIRRLTRQGVLLLVKRLGEKAGVDDVYPHKFRHTFAIQFLRNGGNVFELQQLLGHTDLEMVKNYVKLAQLDLELIARKASPADNWRLR